MTEQRLRFLESRGMHLLLTWAGGVLLAAAVLQLPITVFYQNTRPGLPWIGKERTPQGLIVGLHAGVRPGDTPLRENDVITLIEEAPTDSGLYFSAQRVDFLNGLRIGDTLHLRILREGRPMHLEVPLVRTRAEVQGKLTTLVLYTSNVVSPIVILLVALIVLMRQPRRRESVLFFLPSFCISYYLLLSSGVSQFMPWWRLLSPVAQLLMEPAVILYYPLLLHFLLVFPEERILTTRRGLRSILVYSPYVLALLWIFLLRNSEGIPIAYTYVDLTISVVLPFAGVAVLLASLRAARTALMRKVVHVLLTGYLLFIIANAVYSLMPLLGITDLLSGSALIAITLGTVVVIALSIPLSVGYAILRYGFLDIRIIFKRTTLYAILAGIMALFFIAVYTGLRLLFNAFSAVEIVLISVMITGVVTVGLAMVKERIELFVDRQVFRNEYRRRTALRELSRRLLHMLDRDSLLRALTVDLPAALTVSSASVLSLDRNGEALPLAGAALGAESLRALHAEALRLDAFRDGELLLPHTIPDASVHMQATVLFTIAAENGQQVTVVLGEKLSGRPMTSDEMQALEHVADHAALGWKNAAVTEEMKHQERIKQEIEIAHTIQTSMLPTATPDLPCCELAAVSIPAREVGGDFYDFLRPSDERLAIVMGDVSDKGVSAAMVMASAISILRFAAEENDEPRDILARANHRLYNDTHRHMFVAAFFGVLDMRSGELLFTNAGLPKPLLTRDGESFLIDWSENGQHYPLGTMADISFHQQSLPLQPGDILVLYTDGVVEGCNMHDEEFGFRRLRDVVQATAQLPAEDILDAICREVNAFTGRKELFDDLTLIVMKMRDATA